MTKRFVYTVEQMNAINDNIVSQQLNESFIFGFLKISAVDLDARKKKEQKTKKTKKSCRINNDCNSCHNDRANDIELIASMLCIYGREADIAHQR